MKRILQKICYEWIPFLFILGLVYLCVLHAQAGRVKAPNRECAAVSAGDMALIVRTDAKGRTVLEWKDAQGAIVRTRKPLHMPLYEDSTVVVAHAGDYTLLSISRYSDHHSMLHRLNATGKPVWTRRTLYNVKSLHPLQNGAFAAHATQQHADCPCGDVFYAQFYNKHGMLRKRVNLLDYSGVRSLVVRDDGYALTRSASRESPDILMNAWGKVYTIDKVAIGTEDNQ